MFKNKANKADKAAKQQPVFKQDYFKNCHRTYSCIHCRAHLANHDELISKLFQGNHGRAYLFNKVVNVGCRQAVQRELLTGLHAVADIYCDSCETTLGWKYEQAFVPSQKYKEGKYIIELVHMLKENDWDLNSYNARELLKEAKLSSGMKQLDNNRMANSFKIGDSCYWLGTSEIYESKDKNHIDGSRCEMPSNLGIVIEDQNVELGAQEIAEPLTIPDVNDGEEEAFEMKELAAKQIPPPNYVEEQVINGDDDIREEEGTARVEIKIY